jgi:hypothetical protein
MNRNARITGAIVGAIVGAAVGELLFTASGRRSLERARGLVEKLAGEVRHAGGLYGDVIQEAKRWQPLIQEVREAFGNQGGGTQSSGDGRYDRYSRGPA